LKIICWSNVLFSIQILKIHSLNQSSIYVIKNIIIVNQKEAGLFFDTFLEKKFEKQVFIWKNLFYLTFLFSLGHCHTYRYRRIKPKAALGHCHTYRYRRIKPKADETKCKGPKRKKGTFRRKSNISTKGSHKVKNEVKWAKNGIYETQIDL